jgi:S1-C subfamily serine protease
MNMKLPLLPYLTTIFMICSIKIVTLMVIPFTYINPAFAIGEANLPEFNQKFHSQADKHRIRLINKQTAHSSQQRMAILGTKTIPTSGVVSRFTSGTGFYVDYHHIITNEHVVQSCQHIRIRGAVQPSYAQLLAIDKNSDLALLRTSRSPIRPAPLRGTKEIDVGEKVSVIGYPLENGVTGKYILKDASITDIDNDDKATSRIQFTDSVEKGNSGGPLIDSSGTVIGVIVGKMNYYLNNGKSSQKSKPIKVSSVAINLITLKRFLDKFNILYYTDDVNTPYATPYMEEKAQQYVVNIHCVKSGTEEAGPDPKFPYRQVASTSHDN